MTYYWTSFICFLLATVLHGIFILRKQYLSRVFSLPVMLSAFVGLTVFLGKRGEIVGSCPIGNPLEIVTFILWTSTGLYLFLSLVYSIKFLGLFTAVLSSIAMALVGILPGMDYSYETALGDRSSFIELHASLALVSYGFFALLSILSIMYLVQFYGLSWKRYGSFFSKLPSLFHLEKFQTSILSLSLFVLSVSLFIGSFVYLQDLGEAPLYKLSATISVWIIYFALLVFNLFRKLNSIHFAKALLVGFFIALLALIPVDRARHDLAGNSSEVSAK